MESKDTQADQIKAIMEEVELLRTKLTERNKRIEDLCELIQRAYDAIVSKEIVGGGLKTE